MLRVGTIAVLATFFLAACSSEDEETRLNRELREAQAAMAFCDQAPANCDVEELAKRNGAVSSAESALNKFQKNKK